MLVDDQPISSDLAIDVGDADRQIERLTRKLSLKLLRNFAACIELLAIRGSD